MHRQLLIASYILANVLEQSLSISRRTENAELAIFLKAHGFVKSAQDGLFFHQTLLPLQYGNELRKNFSNK